MKKTIIFCLASAVLAVGLISGAAAVLDSRKEAVLLDEEILYGDRAAAEGLQITSQMELPSGNVQWTLRHKNTDVFGYDVAFHFFHEESQSSYEYDDYSGLVLHTLGNYYSGNDQFWYQDAVYEDLAAKMPAQYQKSRERYTKSVDLADYYEYLPLSFDFSVPGGAADWTPDGAAYALYLKLNEVLRIPVEKGMSVGLRLNPSQYHDGDTLASGYPTGGSGTDRAYIYSASAYTDDGVYFTFSVSPNGRYKLDVSEIELGYGIYYVPTKQSPLSVDDRETMYRQPDPEGLCLGMPLDPDVYDSIQEIVYQEEYDRLFVLVRKNGTTSLLIYEESTRTLLRELELTPPGKGQFRQMRFEDGFLIAIYHDEMFQTIAETESGYDVCITNSYDDIALVREEICLAYDGARLAIVDPNSGRFRDPNTRERSNECYSVRVYTEDGKTFAASYYTNLYESTWNERYYRNKTPLTVEWRHAA